METAGKEQKLHTADKITNICCFIEQYALMVPQKNNPDPKK